MTKATSPASKGKGCLCEQESKKPTRKERSEKKRKNKQQKPPPERHLLYDDPEFLKMLAIGRSRMTY